MHTPLNLQLTPEERDALWLKYNGPVPQQAIEDVIRNRPVRDAEYLTGQINTTKDDLRWERGELLSWEQTTNEWMTGTTRNRIASLERKLKSLEAELDALTITHPVAAE